MASAQKFRSAFNGFNREDVVAYIEYSNSRHETEVLRLKEEIEGLQTRVAELQEKHAPILAADPEQIRKVADLEEMCSRQEEENAVLRQELAEKTGLTDEIEDLKRQLEQTARERDLAAAKRQEELHRAEDELAAYRRAERTERIAQSRASQIYDQANGTLADTAANLDSAAEQLNCVTDHTLDQIRLLQQTILSSKKVVTDASALLSAIRPRDEEN